MTLNFTTLKVYILSCQCPCSNDRRIKVEKMIKQNFGEKFFNQNINEIFFRGSNGEDDLIYEPKQNDTTMIYDKSDKNFRIMHTNAKYDSVKFGTRKYKRKMTKGEFGCLMSHLRAINDIVKNNYPYGIIFEDDFRILSENFYKDLDNALNNAPKNFDILKIDTRSTSVLKKENKNNFTFLSSILNLFNSNKYWQNIRCFFHLTCCSGYIVSLKGAKKIIDFIQNNTLPRECTADVLLWMLLPKKYGFKDFYLIKKPLIAPDLKIKSVINSIGKVRDYDLSKKNIVSF